MAKAYTYLRMSTPEQIEGDSLRRQLDMAERYCRDNGLDLVNDNRFHDIGVSAFRGKNSREGNLAKFFEAVRTREIPTGSFLLIESLDRLSRDKVSQHLVLLMSIVQSGIIVVTLDDGKRYEKDLDALALIAGIVKMMRSHEESETKSRRLSSAWQKKRDDAAKLKLTAQCPSWLRLSADRRIFEIHEERAELIVRIFKMAEEGLGSYAIAHKLNSEGVAPLGKSDGWQKSYVQKILTNEAVIGIFKPMRKEAGKRKPTDVVINDYFPIIVPPETFYKVVAMRSSRGLRSGGRKGRRHPNLFSRLVTCGHCGGPIHFVDTGSQSGTWLACDRSRRGLSNNEYCRVRWRYDDFEMSFLTFVDRVDLSRILGDGTEDPESEALRIELQAAEEKIKELARKRERLVDIFLDGGQGSDYIKQRYEDIEREITAAQDRVAFLTSSLQRTRELKKIEQESIDHIQSQIARIRAGSDAESYCLRSRLSSQIQSIVKRIRMYRSGSGMLDDVRPESLLVDMEAIWLPDYAQRRLQSELDIDSCPRFDITFHDGTEVSLLIDPSDPRSLVVRYTNGSKQFGIGDIAQKAAIVERDGNQYLDQEYEEYQSLMATRKDTPQQ